MLQIWFQGVPTGQNVPHFVPVAFFSLKGNSLGLKELFRMQLPFCMCLFSASCLCRALVPKTHTLHFHSLFLLVLVLASFTRLLPTLCQKSLIQVTYGWVLFLVPCNVSHGTAMLFTSLNVTSLAYLIVCTFLMIQKWGCNTLNPFPSEATFWDPMEVSFLGGCLHWSVVERALLCIPEAELWGVVFSHQVNEALRRISW